MTIFVRGADAITWVHANPRARLLEIIGRTPSGVDSDSLFAVFWNDLTAGMDFDPEDPEAEDDVRAIVQYWFVNNLRAIMQSSETKERKPVVSKAELAAAKANVTAQLRERLRANLYKLVLSNGKELGACTMAEVRAEGGWLVRIAKGRKPDEIVGQVYTPEELRGFLPEQLTADRRSASPGI